MDLNDDRLSDREHREMRETVLAGTQRIRPAGAHRAQLIAGALALVLVGGVSGGAVTTAALWNSAAETPPVSSPTPTPSPTAEPSPTPTPTPMPTPTPAQPEPAAIAAFGGDCAAVLTDDEAATATGKRMGPLEALWSPQTDTRVGGLSCAWTTADEYIGAEIRIEAYPVEAAEAAQASSPESCKVQDAYAECTFAATTHALWIRATVSRIADEGTEIDVDGVRAATQQVLSLAVSRSGEFENPRAATPRDEWWRIDSCAAIVADLEAAGALPAGSVVRDAMDELDQFAYDVIPVRLGAARWCSLEQGVHFLLWPGAAEVFAEVAALDASKPLSVPGADAALLAPSLDAYEGHYPLVLVSDGANMLALSLDDFDGVGQEHLDLAAALLQVMSTR